MTARLILRGCCDGVMRVLWYCGVMMVYDGAMKVLDGALRVV